MINPEVDYVDVTNYYKEVKSITWGDGLFFAGLLALGGVIGLCTVYGLLGCCDKKVTSDPAPLRDGEEQLLDQPE